MTKDQIGEIEEAYLDIFEYVKYKINDERLRHEISLYFLQTLKFVTYVTCNNGNNTPETIDAGVLMVRLNFTSDEYLDITLGYGDSNQIKQQIRKMKLEKIKKC